LSLAALVIGIGCQTATAQQAAPPGMTLPAISATIDFTKDDGGDADEFFAGLEAHSGKAIFLNLEIIPGPDPESAGYALERQSSEAGGNEPADCRSHGFGIVDNLTSILHLSFQHPRHFHSPIEIAVGDRIRFPFQSVQCNPLDVAEGIASLVVTGHFVVTTASIPTATQFGLYPYNP
jgi:hypothetical protein